MKLPIFGRIASAIVLTAGLAGCIDMTMDIEVTSETTARTTVTQTMGAEIYGMMKAADADASSAEASSAEASAEDTASNDQFCTKDQGALTENADGSATCVIVSEGAFGDLKWDSEESKAIFTSAGPGLVRIAIKTEGMAGDLGKESDPQTAAMVKQFFDGHFLTIRFRGHEIVETNATLNDDKTAAEIVIPFVDLLSGTANLPDELYAIVKTN